MKITPEIEKKLNRLSKKYGAIGQDMLSYLEGLIHTSSLTYWDYMHLDTLLSLQTPRTRFPDEKVFITYHQITELYFKLIISEIEQLCQKKVKKRNEWVKRLSRILAYFKNLTLSFDVMIDGMDPQQFLKFRMALLPASGFQSIQYRMLEIMCTDLKHLMVQSERGKKKGHKLIPEQYQHIYWKEGNKKIETGKKTLTLTLFEEKYDDQLQSLSHKYASNNINRRFKSSPKDIQEDPEIIVLLRGIDLYANMYWPLSHFKSAVRYLKRSNSNDIQATGGTNWQKYLPPSYQKIIYFPSVWTKREKKEWGKSWVLRQFKRDNTPDWLRSE